MSVYTLTRTCPLVTHPLATLTHALPTPTHPHTLFHTLSYTPSHHSDTSLPSLHPPRAARVMQAMAVGVAVPGYSYDIAVQELQARTTSFLANHNALYTATSKYPGKWGSTFHVSATRRGTARCVAWTGMCCC